MVVGGGERRGAGPWGALAGAGVAVEDARGGYASGRTGVEAKRGISLSGGRRTELTRAMCDHVAKTISVRGTVLLGVDGTRQDKKRGRGS